ncbi:MAG: S49 family peptidase [Paracoccaceae bacterium]|jgi:signal peptide peptidase SppA|nr:S49 family peptidase [Paracoccaceae bacterium]
MLHPQIAARAFNTPLLVEPAKAQAFLSGLGPRILGQPVGRDGKEELEQTNSFAPVPRASLLAGDLAENFEVRGDTPYPIVDGIAVIEITGVLIHRGAWIGKSSGQTSYEGISAQIDAAATDPKVRGVALEIDSFGGEVAGVFDLADRIRVLRQSKPVWAFVAEHAFSAGYVLASQADRILLPRTGALGSIGVVVMHTDLSGKLAEDGVSVTLIHSGSHKVDGNPYAPLPVDVRDDIQREIDVLRFLFAETVAAGRGAKCNAKAALATEAVSYRGANAVDAGLADEVTDLAGGFERFRAFVTARTSQPSSPALTRKIQKEVAMSNKIPTQDLHATETTEPAAVDTPADDTASASQEAVPPIAAPSEATTAETAVRIRAEAADITEIAAQAARIGVSVDAAKALREGTSPNALRAEVLSRAAAASESRDVIASVPTPAETSPAKESPLVAAAKRTASGAPA